MAVTGNDVIQLMHEMGLDAAKVNKLTLDEPFVNQGFDSIDMPMVAAAAEKKFNVDLSDADGSKLRTVNEFAQFLNGKMK